MVGEEDDACLLEMKIKFDLNFSIPNLEIGACSTLSVYWDIIYNDRDVKWKRKTKPCVGILGFFKGREVKYFRAKPHGGLQ